MDRLERCARAYNNLLDLEYHFIIGRKGKIREINLKFEKEDFHHLLGLHKLKDIEQIRSGRRMQIFDDILLGKITDSKICKSSFYSKMANRIEPLINLESFLDSNDCIIRYDEKRNIYSVIDAGYLLFGNIDITEIFLFIDEDKDRHFCRTFFPKDKTDYTINQMKYTLLKKTKTNTIIQKQEVLYLRDGFE